MYISGLIKPNRRGQYVQYIRTIYMLSTDKRKLAADDRKYHISLLSKPDFHRNSTALYIEYRLAHNNHTRYHIYTCTCIHYTHTRSQSKRSTYGFSLVVMKVCHSVGGQGPSGVCVSGVYLVYRSQSASHTLIPLIVSNTRPHYMQTTWNIIQSARLSLAYWT